MAKRSNGEGSSGWIEKNGRKYWRIRVTTGYDPLTGKQKRKDIYGSTQKEAKKKLKEFQEKNTPHADISKLGEFIYNWLWNVKKPSIAPTTFERWESIYRIYIKENSRLSNTAILDIDTPYMQKVTNELLEDHTLAQVKNMNKLISVSLNYAISIGKIKYNPCTHIIYPKIEKEEKDNYIPEEEQKALIDALNGDDMEGIILLALFTGVRLGEAMAITSDDINMDDMTITINKQVKYIWTKEYDKNNNKIYEYQITRPKTKKGIRIIPLPERMIPVFKAIMLRNKQNKLKYGKLYYDNNLIFCTETGYYIDTKKPNRHLKAALKRAHIKTDLHYHSLRHIFITNCLSYNINPRVVMDFVGHKDMKMTMEVYAEVNNRKNFEEYKKLDNIFD